MLGIALVCGFKTITEIVWLLYIGSLEDGVTDYTLSLGSREVAGKVLKEVIFE